MANYTLTPSPWQTFFYANGAPVASGQLFTYLAGTTTPAPTYLNASGTPNTNPIILDAAGRAVIYLAGGSYRFDLYDSVANGGALIKTEDNITSVPVSASQPADSGVAGATILAGQAVYLSDGSGGLTAGRWYLAQANNAYSSTIPEVGFAAADTSAGNAIAIIRIGQVFGLTVTTGLAYYIDPTTAGAVTATAPLLARYMGQADTASSFVVGNAPPGQPLGATSTVLGTQNNFNPPGFSNFNNGLLILRMNNAGPTTLTGIVAGYPGQRLIILAFNGQVDLPSNSGLSLPANRLLNVVTSGNTSLAPSTGGVASAEYVYDAGGAWRLIHHEQGAWISAPFASGNFTGSGFTWTVAAGNLAGLSYKLSGRSLQVKWQITSSSVSGTPNNTLIINAPAYGGYSLAATYGQAEPQASVTDAGVAATAYAQALSTQIALVRANGNWGVSAGLTSVLGGLTFEVL